MSNLVKELDNLSNIDCLKWLFPILLLLMFLWCVLGNTIGLAVVAFQQKYSPKKVPNSSAVPLIGGISGMIALLIIPIQDVAKWWWVPLILDYGCIPVFVHSVIHHFIESRKINDAAIVRHHGTNIGLVGVLICSVGIIILIVDSCADITKLNILGGFCLIGGFIMTMINSLRQ